MSLNVPRSLLYVVSAARGAAGLLFSPAGGVSRDRMHKMAEAEYTTM